MENKKIKNKNDKLKLISEKLNRYISFKRYIFALMGISFLFAYYGQLKIGIIYMVFSFIGMYFHDTMLNNIYKED